MYQQIKRRREAEGLSAGFTLIELLIVIVVLGILAGVVVFALGGVTSKSALAACQADGATVSTAIAAYNAQNTSTPVTVSALTTGTNVYIQSWPSNIPHYAFAISDGVTTYTGLTTTPAAGTLLVATTPAGAVTAASPWALYTGAGACANVK